MEWMEELLLSAIECTGPGGVKETDIHTREPFVPEPSVSEFEVTIRKLKACKSPGSDQIPAELIQGKGGYCILRFVKLLFFWNKEELSHKRKESIVFTKMVIKLTVVIIDAYH
jgi:hypothetical protein